MRKLIVLGLILAGVWGLGAFGVTRGVDAALNALRTEGWTIEATPEIALSPALMGSSIGPVSAISPAGWWRGETDNITVGLRSLAPTTLQTTISAPATIGAANAPVTLTDGVITANLRVGVRSNAPVRLFELSSARASLEGALPIKGWDQFEFEALEIADGQFALTGQLAQVPLSDQLRASIDPNGAHPPAIESIALVGSVTFDGPFSLADDTPRYLTQINIDTFTTTWGDVALAANGTLDIDANGVPTGVLTFNITGANTIIDLLTETGAIPREVAPNYRAVVAGMTAADGTLALPITLRGGRMSVGFIPLGPAPIFR